MCLIGHSASDPELEIEKIFHNATLIDVNGTVSTEVSFYRITTHLLSIDLPHARFEHVLDKSKGFLPCIGSNSDVLCETS